jgi:hypothetical protein
MTAVEHKTQQNLSMIGTGRLTVDLESERGGRRKHRCALYRRSSVSNIVSNLAGVEVSRTSFAFSFDFSSGGQISGLLFPAS